jgi:hypothetical protein
LIGNRKDENILDEIMGEWHELEIMGKILPLLDPLHKISSAKQDLNIDAVIHTSVTSLMRALVL